MPHGLSLSADAAHLHGDRAGGPLPHHRHHASDAGNPRKLPVGHVPAQSRRTDAGNGDRRRARLPVVDLCLRSARAHQSRHSAAARPPDGQRPAQDRIDELDPDVDAGHADHLLRRRDRHGRQYLSWRPQWRAHAHAMDAGPQRRLLARRPGAALSALHHGPGLRLLCRQRGGADPLAVLAVELDEAADRRAQIDQGVRPRHAHLHPPVEPGGTRLCAPARRRGDPLRRQYLALGASGGARPARLGRPHSAGNARPHALSAHRRTALPGDAAALRLLLVLAWPGG